MSLASLRARVERLATVVGRLPRRRTARERDASALLDQLTDAEWDSLGRAAFGDLWDTNPREVESRLTPAEIAEAADAGADQTADRLFAGHPDTLAACRRRLADRRRAWRPGTPSGDAYTPPDALPAP